MMVAVEIPRMGKKKMGRPSSGRDDVAVKVDRRIVTMARFIANKEGVSLAQLLSEILDRPINLRYAKLVMQSEAELKRPKDDDREE